MYLSVTVLLAMLTGAEAFVGGVPATKTSSSSSSSSSLSMAFIASNVDMPISSASSAPMMERIIINNNNNINVNNLPRQTTTTTTLAQGSKALLQGIQEFIVPPAYAASTSADKVKPPTDSEVKLLRDALGALYGERNPERAEVLLSQAITAWERQAPDERAALYRVRADCYMALLKAAEAEKDYTTTIDLLSGPGGNLADPAELPSALLGRARALRSLPGQQPLSPAQSKLVSQDYQISLRLSTREDWDTDEENEQDGAQRNPYAAWEWGMAKRSSGDYVGAAEIHKLASLAFKDIGDRARSVISDLDAGIDLAATDDVKGARELLESAIKRTTSVEGNDVELLQRVIAKEGEARMALASVLWSANDKAAAEAQFGEACGRLDQLQADADAREAARRKSGAMPPVKVEKLKFTIDDTVGTECSCSRFKNEKFLSERLAWPESLQQKVFKLNNLGKS